MKIPKDGKICQKGWIKPNIFLGKSAYEQVYVYTIFPDKTALVEYRDGKTEYVNAENVIWNCCCASLILFKQGCQCGGE